MTQAGAARTPAHLSGARAECVDTRGMSIVNNLMVCRCHVTEDNNGPSPTASAITDHGVGVPVVPKFIFVVMHFTLIRAHQRGRLHEMFVHAVLAAHHCAPCGPHHALHTQQKYCQLRVDAHACASSSGPPRNRGLPGPCETLLRLGDPDAEVIQVTPTLRQARWSAPKSPTSG